MFYGLASVAFFNFLLPWCS